LAVELGVEGGDLADGVGVEVLLEVALESGQVVGDQPVVQSSIFRNRFDRVIQFLGDLRVGPADTDLNSRPFGEQ